MKLFSTVPAGARQNKRSYRGLWRLAATALLTAVSFAGAINTARFTVTDSGTSIPRGSTGNQTITVTNVGPNTGTNVVATYKPPTTTGIKVNSVTATPGGATSGVVCTLNAGLYTCPPVASVALNGTLTLTVNVTVDASVAEGTSAGSTVKVDSAEFNPGSGTGESLFNIWGARGVSGAAGDAYWYGFDGNYNDTGIKTETGSANYTGGSKIAAEWPVTQASPPGKYSLKPDKANDDTDKDATYATYGTAVTTPAAPKNSTVETTPPSINLPEVTTDSRNNRRVWEIRTGIYLAKDGPLYVCVPQPDDAMYVAVDGRVVAYANTYNGGVVNSSGGTFAAGYHEVVYRIVNRNNQTSSFEHGIGGFGVLGMGTSASGSGQAGACSGPNYNAFTNVAPASDVTVGAASADLVVTKTNGVTSVASGGATTYTIRVTNNGPSTVTGATLTDTPGAGLTLTGTACTAATGNTCTAVPTGSPVTLPALAQGAFYEINVTANVTATGGSVTNTAAVSLPASVTDPTPGNNSAADTDTVTLSADLGITKTGPASADAGTQISYLLTISNAGPSAANGATFSDNVPNNLTGVTATCRNPSGGAAGCTASVGAGNNVTGSITLPSGGRVEVLIQGTIPPGATASLSNTATVKAPTGTTDPNAANNTSQTVSTALTRTADLGVTKTNGVTVVRSGQVVTYTIVVSNAGPSFTTASFSDTTFSGVALSGWTCTVTSGASTCPTSLPTSGGYSNGLLNLQPGSVLTFTVKGEVTATGGTVGNTATLTAPSGTTDPNPGNNSATDTDSLMVGAPGLSKTVANITNPRTGGPSVKIEGRPGDLLEYCIAFRNGSNAALPNFTITDNVPANTTGQKDAYGSGQGVRIVRGTADPTYQPFSNPVVVNLGTLLPAAGGSVCFRATIN